MRIHKDDLNKMKDPSSFIYKVYKIKPLFDDYSGEAFIAADMHQSANIEIARKKVEDHFMSDNECLFAYSFVIENDWTGELSDEFFFTYGIEWTP